MLSLISSKQAHSNTWNGAVASRARLFWQSKAPQSQCSGYRHFSLSNTPGRLQNNWNGVQENQSASPKYSQHKQAAHTAVTVLDSTENKIIFLCPHTGRSSFSYSLLQEIQRKSNINIKLKITNHPLKMPFCWFAKKRKGKYFLFQSSQLVKVLRNQRTTRL